MSAELYRNVAIWAICGETGMSSKAMAAAALGLRRSYYAHPRDPSDLNRCIKLVKAVPAIREHFPKIAAISAQYTKLIENWDSLVALFHAECGENWSRSLSAPCTFNRMKELGL
jgi:hypothetical protein